MAEWCAVWGLNHGVIKDRFEATRRGTLLMGLAASIRREAAELPDGFHPDLLLKNFVEVEALLDQFTILPATTMQQMYEQMKGTGWQCLELMDAMLSSHRPERAIERDKLREHLEQVRALIDGILQDPDLPADLKRYIVQRLRDVEQALVDAAIHGVASVELAASSLLGASQLDRDWWDRVAQTRWAPRIGAVWMAIVTTLGAAGGIPALMPGSQAPVVEQSVTVNVTVEDDDDVVDAEVIEDSRNAAPRHGHRRSESPHSGRSTQP
jgi:hypothetical protein